MKKQSKALVVLVAFVCIAGFMIGCGDETAEQTPVKVKVPANVEPIKVGAVFAITGSASWLGEPERNTAKMLEKQINAAGGINGRPLELIIEDSEGDNTKALLAINKLIKKEGVCAIIGPSRSGTSMAIKATIEENKIPLISCAAAEQIVKPVIPWVFKTPQNDSDCVIRIYEHMKSVDVDQIAIITGTTGFGQAGRGQLQKIATEMGITILADETYGPTDTDMTAQLTRIRGTKAQAIVNWSIVPAQSIVPKNMKQLNMDIQLYQSHGFGNERYVKAAGEAADGLIFPAGGLLVVDTLPDTHPRKALLAKYKADYEKEFDATVSTFGGHAYDALSIVVEALKATGSDDKGKIRDYLETIQGFDGTAGTFNYSAEDHSGLQKDAFELITVKDGKFVLYQQ